MSKVKSEEVKSEEVTSDEIKNEITEKKQNSVAVHQPQEATGFEDMTSDVQLMLPFVKVMQSNSPELDIPDLNFRKGDLVHSLLLEKVPELFVPLKFFDTKILLVPKNAEQKEALRIKLNLSKEEIEASTIVCQAKDGKTGTRYGNCAQCGKANWDNVNGEKPLCTQSINVLGIFAEKDSEGKEDLVELPAVLRFANTSFKHGRKMLSVAKFSQKIYSMKYRLTAKLTQGEGNISWFELLASPAGKVAAELVPRVKEWFDLYATQSVEIDNEADMDEPVIEETDDF